jgi:hypothetical protein
LSRDEVIGLVQEYVERTDERARDNLLRDPPDNEDQKAEMKVRKEVDLQTLRDRDDPNAAASIYLTGKKILGGAGVCIEGLPYPEFVELVRRAFGELADQFMALTEEAAAANRTSQKWVDKQRANVALLRDIIGNATPIRDVDYDACLQVRSILGRVLTAWYACSVFTSFQKMMSGGSRGGRLSRAWTCGRCLIDSQCSSNTPL